MRAAAAAAKRLVFDMTCHAGDVGSPAAAAASWGVRPPPEPGLRGDLIVAGLRLLGSSEDLLGGDLERRSNRERLISGSVWSNRDRLLLRSSSAIFVYENFVRLQAGRREMFVSFLCWNHSKEGCRIRICEAKCSGNLG